MGNHGGERFCRFSLALLPLGLAMWGAHLLFHLSTGWSTAWPVAQRAAGDLGAGWLGTPRWTASSALFAPHVTLAIQVLLLDAGVLLSLYVGWRIARSHAKSARDGLLLVAPLGGGCGIAVCGWSLDLPAADANAGHGTRVKITPTLLTIVMLAPLIAHADGGTVQLREASGPFVVTVFTAPETLRAGPIDTSVLVQDRETGRVILDATVTLALQPAAGAGPRFQARATHVQARNKLLQAAIIEIPAAGWWTMQISASRDGAQAVVATKVLVLPAAPRVVGIWPFLIVPPVAIALFALHQGLRRDSQTP